MVRLLSLVCSVLSLLPAADRTVELEALVRDAYRAGAEVEDFYHPQPADLAHFRLLVRQLHALPVDAPETLVDAPRRSAIALGFTLARWHHCHLLREQEPGRGRGLYLIAPTPARPDLVVQAPHSRNDRDTEILAARFFLHTGAAALQVSTISRHAVPAATDEPHGPADPCHHEAHFLQAATQGSADALPGVLILQFHGYGTRDEGPLVGLAAVLSEGVKEASDATRRCERALETLWPGAVGLYASEVEELGATTNVQGRWLRGASDDRFLHLELAPTSRQDLLGGRIPLADFASLLLEAAIP